DFLARILEAAMRMASLPAGDQTPGAEWDSAIAISDQKAAFAAAYGAADEESVPRFLAFDPANPSSIRNCLAAARNNARAVRTALTTEVWEAVN
ncbi:alpha-E domain-containing protein, partial [Listeria monocytogenes]|uniref:alpha-E domain-containing protein n=1 Tax=Listeria monocytogenes TaxID=1639 RepID=UPI003FA47F18